MSYSSLTGDVVSKLEIDSSDLSRFRVVESLNSAQLSLLSILPKGHLRNAIKTTQMDLLQNVVRYQWPPDFIRILNVWLDYSNPISDTNEGVEALPFNKDDFHSNMRAVSTVNYPFYDVHTEGGLELGTIPTANVTKGGRLRYVWRFPAISSSQKSLLNISLRNLLVFRATSLSALVEDHKPDLAKKYGDLYDKELAQIMPKEERG